MHKSDLKYSKNQIKKAGRDIRKGLGDQAAAKEVIQCFRAAHAEPLSEISDFVYGHLDKLGLSKDAILVRRLKRLPTIIDKLTRSSLDSGASDNAIDITRMQDIGGCRVIVKNKHDLLKLNKSLENNKTYNVVRVNKYLDNAKDTGYRGIHRAYITDSNFRIELQMRTHKQHVWATGVELIDVITKTTLKTDPLNACSKLKRFFVLLSEYIAIIDEFVSVEHVSKELATKYQEEFCTLTQELNIIDLLENFDRAIAEVNENTLRDDKYLLIGWYASNNNGFIELFDDEQEASERYAEVEQQSHADAVLIATTDFTKLRKAYPNYCGDTREFVALIAKALMQWPHC